MIEKNEFLKAEEGNAYIVFSTAKAELNFNINEDEGKKNLSKLKEWFGLEDIGYLYQKHSSNIFIYDGEIHEGDAIITNKKNIGIGVFTADCVPIIIYDKFNNAIAAVHSGWKGTLNKITEDTITKMQQVYGSNPENLVVYIGPHNRGCCYEVGNDVAGLFNDCDLYKGSDIVNRRKLNLEKCIIAQLGHKGVLMDNIKTMDMCTFCSEKTSLYSYRKLKDSCGRMFSFIYLT
jgi:YfiH family protein